MAMLVPRNVIEKYFAFIGLQKIAIPGIYVLKKEF
jgi:hypothetical protein